MIIPAIHSANDKDTIVFLQLLTIPARHSTINMDTMNCFELVTIPASIFCIIFNIYYIRFAFNY